MLHTNGAPKAANHATATTTASATDWPGPDRIQPDWTEPWSTSTDPSQHNWVDHRHFARTRGRRNLRRNSVQEQCNSQKPYDNRIITVQKPPKSGFPTSFTTITIINMATIGHLPWPRHCRHTHHNSDNNSSDQRWRHTHCSSNRCLWQQHQYF